MESRFPVSDRVIEMHDSLYSGLCEGAREFCAELRGEGLDLAEATSIIANAMIRAAWTTAAAGAITTYYRAPRPNAFRRCVEEILATTVLNMDEDQGGEGWPEDTQ